MERYFRTAAIVLRTADFGESSRMLTAFSREAGLISIRARGVRRTKSASRASAQIFCYSMFTLYRGSGDLYTLTDAEILESFHGVASNLDSFRVAARMARLLLQILQPELPDPETLRLLLNSLYCLTEEKRTPRCIQAVFLLRLLNIQGVLPDPDTLARNQSFAPRPETKMALRYILSADMEKLFGLRAEGRILDELESIAERSEKEYL